MSAAEALGEPRADQSGRT